MQSVRAHKTRLFVDVNDGTGPTHTQLVVPLDLSNRAISPSAADIRVHIDVSKVRPGAYVRARGSVQPMPVANKNPWLREEMHCTELSALSPSDPSVRFVRPHSMRNIFTYCIVLYT